MKSTMAVTLAAVVVTLASARATTIVTADLGELARDARAIAVGRVTTVESQWIADRRAIETLVTLDVDEYLKGDLGSTLRFRVPGGQLGPYKQIVIGSPEFRSDEHVAVFVGVRGPGVPFVLGLGQGVLRMARSPDGRGWMVTSPVVWPAAASGPVVRGDPARRPIALGDFETRVRALAGGAR